MFRKVEWECVFVVSSEHLEEDLEIVN